MFGKLTDLGAHRDFWGAVQFYFAHTVILVGLATVLVHVLTMMGVVHDVGSFFAGGDVNTMIGSAFVLFLSSMMLTQRKLTGDLLSIILVVVGLFLSWNVGVLVGMVPVAFLTTLKS